jgi:thymidylate synthase
MEKFKTAEEAFIYYYKDINENGIKLGNTKAILNVGFYIDNPINNDINVGFRKWKREYANKEWEWYLSKNRSIEEIKKHAKIWDKMHNGDNIVNSNYGWQWSRNNQLDFIVNELTLNPNSRRAFITIYDGKEHSEHKLDTPCTLNIGFNIQHGKLNMSVLMRSNDLWFGFCNDQFCFSNLQVHLANVLNLEIGSYFHFANNLHLYEKHFSENLC